MEARKLIQDVAVSTRIRLARNLAKYPFPNKLQSEAQAREIVFTVSELLKKTEESFELYPMNNISAEVAAYLKERNLISQTLIDHRHVSAALVSEDESISVLINEEDHIREQYFRKGFDLINAYERILGIDDILAENMHFAYDDTLGYLTACPTNLGTGLRASVMLFLPALTRRKRIQEVRKQLVRQGLTVRGAFGEGSVNEGELYQVSNEVTLGRSEEEILTVVQSEVEKVIQMELVERDAMLAQDGAKVIDTALRSYGILTSCFFIDAREFLTHMANVKLGVALGILEGEMEPLDNLLVDMRPANLRRIDINGAPRTQREEDILRAKYAGRELRNMQLFSEGQREKLFVAEEK